MTFSKRLAVVLAAVAAVVMATIPALPVLADTAAVGPGQSSSIVDVALDPVRAGPSSAADVARAASGSLVGVVGAGTADPVVVVRVAAGSSASAARRAERDVRVAWAEPDTRMFAADEPNDPCYQKTSACPGTPGQVDQDDFKLMNAPAAWAITKGDPSVGVAVLDTRVETTHVDLQDKVVTGPTFLTDTTSCPATTPFPDHGTHVTGTIAAATDNNVGVAGLGWNTRVLSIRVLDDCGAGLSSDIAQGIDAAVAAGARVINMSLAGQANRTLSQAVARAVRAGVVLVAAAGNDSGGQVSNTNADYPAMFPGVLGVAATTRNDVLAGFSNFGTWIPLAAPGDRIWSTISLHRVGVESGTSMAAPHVAAVAALMFAAAPKLTGFDVAAKLEQTAVAIPGTGTQFRYGRVDAAAAVASAAVVPPVGYRQVASDGGIFDFGADAFYGSTAGAPLNRPIVAAVGTPTGRGYRLAASDGGIFVFGDAGFYGSTGAVALNQPIVAMAATPTGRGYWLVASDGGIFAFGDAGFFGSTGSLHLNKPIVGMASTPTGDGYWLVASDGGIFSFGDAGFFGSTGAVALNQPIVAIAATRTGNGYTMLARDGGIFTFGDAAFFGSTGGIPLNQPIVGIEMTATGLGYWLVASDGGIFSFGDAGFLGSTGGIHLNKPIVAIT
jgi:subtilisin family serine protease